MHLSPSIHLIETAKGPIVVNQLADAHEVLSPLMSAQDMEMARAAQRFLMDAVGHSQAAVIRLTTEAGDQPAISVPMVSLKFIGQLLGAMSEGRALTFVPLKSTPKPPQDDLSPSEGLAQRDSSGGSAKQELSTVEVARFLNVSRPFVIKEIAAGRLPHRMVGTHRRVALDDLMAYARKMRENQAGALERMAENARELGLDY